MTHRSVMDLTRQEWLDALHLDPGQIPQAVIMEGSWWRAERTAWRLGYLEDVQELAFPDMFLGRWQGKPVVYSCVYGAPRAVELAHLFGVIGVPRMVMIGTCGGLQPGMRSGDVVVPTTAGAQEGVARLYGAAGRVNADPQLARAGREHLADGGFAVHDTAHLTWYSIFAQSGEMVEDWRRLGYGSVDMETATLYAVARHFGFAAAALLVVWDLLDQNRSFLDPLQPEEQHRLDRANKAVFETALAITLGEPLP